MVAASSDFFALPLDVKQTLDTARPVDQPWLRGAGYRGTFVQHRSRCPT